VKTQASFLEYARKLKWFDSMLQHIAMDGSDLDDAAEWLCYYIGKNMIPCSPLHLNHLAINWCTEWMRLQLRLCGLMQM